MLIEKFLFTTAAEHHLGNAAILESWARMKETNRDWKITIFSDSQQAEFLKQNLSPRVFESYKAINPVYGAAKADFFRYCVSYLLGGVYIDVKSHISAPLNAILRDRDQCLIGQWDNRPGQAHANTWGKHDEISHVMGGEFIQWFIVAKSRHPFLKAVIEKVVRNIEAEQLRTVDKASGWKGVLTVTGPIAFTQAIAGVINEASMVRNSQHYRYFNFWENSFHYSIFEDSFINDVARGQGWTSLGPEAAESLQRSYVQGHYSTKVEPVVIESSRK